MKLEDYSLRLKKLQTDIEVTERNGWIRNDHFIPWIEEFNALVTSFNIDYKRQVPKQGISDTFYSRSGKTIKAVALDTLKGAIINLRHSIENTLKIENEEKHRFQCFKIGHKCPHEIVQHRYIFFVGMPFNDKFQDSYTYGIKETLDNNGVECDKKVFRADEKFSNFDIMCKVCRAIQESEYVIINISDENPNVMFELGLAYGLNKYVILIKDISSSVISDLKGLEYIEYAHAGELSQKLLKRFRELEII